jgi:hypothetical protein
LSAIAFENVGEGRSLLKKGENWRVIALKREENWSAIAFKHGENGKAIASSLIQKNAIALGYFELFISDSEMSG